MTDQDIDALSAREREVATAYVDGQSYKELARALGIAPSTVRTHLRTVYRKLGVTSRLELANTLDANADAGQPVSASDDADIVAELALELDDAMRRERILAKVLRIISKQGHSLDDVIDAVLSHALEICEAEFGILFEYHGDLRFRAMQSQNIAPAFGRWLEKRDVFAVDPETGLGRVATRHEPVSIADVRGEDIYRSGAPLRVATADLGKARSFVAIPILWGERLLGAFTVYRTRVHPFNDRTLELAQLFADQAAIAIENARNLPADAAPALAAVAQRDAAAIRAGETGGAGPETLPLLAILPFRAVDEKDGEVAAVGRRLAASICMEMTSSPLFRVVDQASSLSPALDPLSPLDAAGLLGARLVVSGAIRRLAGGGYRITPMLHEAGRPAPRWNDFFETHGGDTYALLDSMLARLCAAIGTGIERQLLDAAPTRRSANQSAMDHFLDGLHLHHRHENCGFADARHHFESALTRDPEFGRAAAALAITYVREWFWDSGHPDLLDTAQTYARRAVGLAPHDPWAQTVWGAVALYQRRHVAAAASFERAMELAPHDAYVLSRTALGKFYGGEFQVAITLFERVTELDPLHANRQRAMLGHALFHAGQYDKAITALEATENPRSWELALLACCYAANGDMTRAKATADRFRADEETARHGSAHGYRAHTRPFQHPADKRRLETAMQALRIALA